MDIQSVGKIITNINYGKSSLQTTPLAQKIYGNKLSLATIGSLEKLATILQMGGTIADLEKENIKTVRSKTKKNIKGYNESKQEDSDFQ